jgi:hypothetical protein
MVVLRRAGSILGLSTFLVALAIPQTALAGPPWATDEPSFQSSYLQSGDLPAASDKTGDWTGPGCDGASAANGCSFTGKKLWTAKDPAAAVWQVHDIRWVFPDAAAAQRYMQQGTQELAEGLPPVSQPPMVGSDTQMYTAQGDTYGVGVEMIMYDLVFRVDNVVVKIFVSQGPERTAEEDAHAADGRRTRTEGRRPHPRRRALAHAHRRRARALRPRPHQRPRPHRWPSPSSRSPHPRPRPSRSPDASRDRADASPAR